jgi:hypothetical protein
MRGPGKYNLKRGDKMKTTDRILLETDLSCSVCGIKGRENLTKHHIDSNSKNNAYENLVVVCYNCHQRITQRAAITRKQIEEIKRLLILKTLTPFGVNAIKIAYRNAHGEVTGMELILNHLADLGYLRKKAWALKSGVDDESEALSVFEITKPGRRLHDKWIKPPPQSRAVKKCPKKLF